MFSVFSSDSDCPGGAGRPAYYGAEGYHQEIHHDVILSFNVWLKAVDWIFESGLHSYFKSC